jgi:lantibiotic biosynthesis protein
MTRSQNQNDFAPSGFFAFRTPLLPFDELLAWSEGLKGLSALGDQACLEQALSEDRNRLRDRLSTALSRPEVREALFVASPDLDESIHRWLREPESEKGQRIERALVRYFSRMCGRSTPFGLFAGCSVGTVGEQTHFEVAELAACTRHTRLDMDYLYALIDILNRDPEVRNSLIYRPNSSLYRAAGRVRYVETRLDGEARSYFLVAVEDTEYLSATLEKAKLGADLNSLASALVEADPEIESEEAQEYIKELVDNQLLVSELSPVVTGPEPIHTLIDQLKEHEMAPLVVERLEKARTALDAIDADGLGVASERYREIAKLLEVLPAKVELPRLFQVDMVKPVAGLSIGPEPLAEITRAIEILHQLFRRRAESEMGRFRDAFLARYNPGQEVPLLNVLDEEVGIGFNPSTRPSAEASPLLRELEFSPADDDETEQFGARYTFLLRKLQEAALRGEDEIALTARDIERLKNKDLLPLPDAFACMATLIAESEEALKQGDFRVYFMGGSGPSGARLLGRFCHADKELHRQVDNLLRSEEAFEPNAIFAEIVHLPEGRIGNILLRPLMRDYEIPYIGRSGATLENQITVDDLLVTVINNRVVLRSKRLGRQVIPRLSSAHNYGWRSLGVYKFLCSIQDQGFAGSLSWNWGALGKAPFLPRVTLGRIIFSRAQWNVNKEELEALSKLRGAALFAAVQNWRQERRLPRWVSLVDADNELPVDLDNVLSIETFINLVKNRQEAKLSEMLGGLEQLLARGPEGRFVHELVVPFTRTRPREERKPARAGVGEFKAQRTFPPGSEWLYAKLYTGTATVDRVLCDVVQPLAESAIRSGAADQWFFIRYSDPDWHLRLRFHGDPGRLHSDVLSALQEAVSPLLNDGRLWRIQLDTYEREIERYGGEDGMVLSEKIFHADSEAVAAIIDIVSGDEGAHARWKLALCGTDMLLSDLGLNLERKHAVMKQIREGFGYEFRADVTDLKHQLGKKYMKERKSLESLIIAGLTDEPQIEDGIAVLQRRSERLAPLVAQLRSVQESGRLTTTIEDLVGSYIHMHINRLLRAAQRAQELVIYDFLVRLYDSQIARAKSKK